MVRRLSNVEELGSQRKFRLHRDSVTLARERRFNAGGVSPGPSMKRDPVSITRKRMLGSQSGDSTERDVWTKAEDGNSIGLPIRDVAGVGYHGLKGAEMDHAMESPLSPAVPVLLSQGGSAGHHIRIIKWAYWLSMHSNNGATAIGRRGNLTT